MNHRFILHFINQLLTCLSSILQLSRFLKLKPLYLFFRIWLDRKFFHPKLKEFSSLLLLNSFLLCYLYHLSGSLNNLFLYNSILWHIFLSRTFLYTLSIFHSTQSLSDCFHSSSFLFPTSSGAISFLFPNLLSSLSTNSDLNSLIFYHLQLI